MQIGNLARGFLNFFVGLVELFLAFRFVLKLFGANAANGFVDWIYDMSDALLEPFRGIFPVRVFENAYVLEFSTLFAMLVYLIAGLLLLALIDTIVPQNDEEVVVKEKRKR
jgi:uncharacterized protein YggT (Ycf19 family)